MEQNIARDKANSLGEVMNLAIINVSTGELINYRKIFTGGWSSIIFYK